MKILIQLTRLLRIYNLLKKIMLLINSKFGLGHGHNLFLFIIKKKKTKFKNFLEIGSTREEIYGQGSTEIIAKYCERKKINFYSIDADQRNIDRLKKNFLLINILNQSVIKVRIF